MTSRLIVPSLFLPSVGEEGSSYLEATTANGVQSFVYEKDQRPYASVNFRANPESTGTFIGLNKCEKGYMNIDGCIEPDSVGKTTPYIPTTPVQKFYMEHLLQGKNPPISPVERRLMTRAAPTGLVLQ